MRTVECVHISLFQYSYFAITQSLSPLGHLATVPVPANLSGCLYSSGVKLIIFPLEDSVVLNVYICCKIRGNSSNGYLSSCLLRSWLQYIG